MSETSAAKAWRAQNSAVGVLRKPREKGGRDPSETRGPLI